MSTVCGLQVRAVSCPSPADCKSVDVDVVRHVVVAKRGSSTTSPSSQVWFCLARAWLVAQEVPSVFPLVDVPITARLRSLSSQDSVDRHGL